MANMNLPIEIYDVLERKLGRDDAMAVAKSIQDSLSHIEERSREIVVQRKMEAKEELKTELRDELATKADIAELIGKSDSYATRADLAKMDKKFTVLWLITIFTVIFLNQNALEFLARLLGLIK
jgi:hypothetical protein